MPSISKLPRSSLPQNPELINISASLFNSQKLLEDLNSLLDTGLAKPSFASQAACVPKNFDYFSHINKYRNLYIQQYGFKILSDDYLQGLYNILKNHTTLEVASGSGYLSYCLKNLGLSITSADAHPPHSVKNKYGFQKSWLSQSEQLNVECVQYLKQNSHLYSCVICSWPDYKSDFARNILNSMIKDQTLIYIGESRSGCTASDEFFDLLETKCVLQETETSALQSLDIS